MLYLELIWIEDEHAVEQQAVRTGIDLGRFIGSTQEHLLLNRSTRQIWHCRVYGTFNPHWAEWMRPDMSIRFAAENLASVEEPIYFVILTYALTTWLDRSCSASAVNLSSAGCKS